MQKSLLTLVIVLGVILFSMVLHELAHGLVAYWLGDRTAKDDGRLTLNPLKHLDPFMSILIPVMLYLSGGPIFGGAKPVPVNTRNLKFGAWGMALVAVAGPLTNFIIAFVSFAIGSWTSLIQVSNGGLYYAGNIWSEIVVELVMVNLGFGIFNLIPIPPLDGSRVLYALAPDPVREIMEKMEGFGIIIVMVLVVFASGFFSNILSGAMEGVLTAFAWLVG